MRTVVAPRYRPCLLLTQRTNVLRSELITYLKLYLTN